MSAHPTLAKVLFPIGHLQKAKCERSAAQDLVTAEKKDSQGLCFIGKVRLPDFLQQQLAPKKGAIVEVPASFSAYEEPPTTFDNQQQMLAYHSGKIHYTPSDGAVVGEHQGAHYFTKGQRKGLGVGGTVEPLFVIATDVNENVIYTGQGKDHPGLYRGLLVQPNDIHWVREDLRMEIGETLKTRIRYRQPLEKATFIEKRKVCLYFDTHTGHSRRAICRLHSEELLGSGVIS